MRAQLSGKRFLTGAATDRHGTKSHTPCELHAEMSETSKALDGH